MGDERELVRVQRLHMRLLYDQPLAAAYAEAPDDVLRAHDLPSRWRRALPESGSEGHLAEMYGRRVLAAQELLLVYAATLAHLVPAPPATDTQIIERPWFTEFLASDVFFEPEHSLPHPTGLGRGYEGYGRFFFWARDAFALRTPQADLQLRDDLYLDLVAYLDNAKAGASDPGWQRLSRGFFWSTKPLTDSPCRGLTSERKVFRRDEPRARQALQAQGLCDMDELTP